MDLSQHRVAFTVHGYENLNRLQEFLNKIGVKSSTISTIRDKSGKSEAQDTKGLTGEVKSAEPTVHASGFLTAIRTGKPLPIQDAIFGNSRVDEKTDDLIRRLSCNSCKAMYEAIVTSESTKLSLDQCRRLMSMMTKKNGKRYSSDSAAGALSILHEAGLVQKINANTESVQYFIPKGVDFNPLYVKAVGF